jgi:hypothetical protein
MTKILTETETIARCIKMAFSEPHLYARERDAFALAIRNDPLKNDAWQVCTWTEEAGEFVWYWLGILITRHEDSYERGRAVGYMAGLRRGLKL